MSILGNDWGAISGAISGAGEAGTKALSNAQTFLGQAFLQSEREKFETARDQMHEEHATTRETNRQTFEAGQNQVKLESDRALHAGDQAARARETNKTIGANQALEESRQAGELLRENKRNKATGEIHAEDRKLKQQEIDNLKDYHDKYVARLNRLAGSGTEHLPPKLKAQLEVLNHEAEGHIKAAEKFHELAAKYAGDDPKLSSDYQTKAESELRQLSVVNRNREGLLDLKIPAQTEGVGPAIKNRFGPTPAELAAQGGPGTAAAATGPVPKAAPQGILQTVERTRPTMPRGRVAPEKADQVSRGQLDYDIQEKEKELEQAKIHGNKQLVQRMQDQLDALESRKAAATEGK